MPPLQVGGGEDEELRSAPLARAARPVVEGEAEKTSEASPPHWRAGGGEAPPSPPVSGRGRG